MKQDLLNHLLYDIYTEQSKSKLVYLREIRDLGEQQKGDFYLGGKQQKGQGRGRVVAYSRGDADAGSLDARRQHREAGASGRRSPAS